MCIRDSTYIEPMATVKRRAFVRARERHKIFCDRRHIRFEVTENGDLLIKHEITQLQLVSNSEDYTRRRHNLFVPTYGRVVVALRLDDASYDRGYRIERD